MHRNDVRRTINGGDAQLLETAPQRSHDEALLSPQLPPLFASKRAHGGQRSGQRCRRQARGEDEAGGVAPNEVDKCRRASHVAADVAVGLAEGATDHVHFVRAPELLRSAGAVVTIQAHGVHLIAEGERAVVMR